MEQISVSLRYFAMLRDITGVEHEKLTTNASTPSELYDELRQSKGFTLDKTQVRVALNGEFAQLDDQLNDGDELAFIPPVSGG